MIQIFMVFPSKVGAPGHVSGMCSSLWTTWARKKVPEVNICIWEVQFGGCGGTGGPTAVRTSFAIVLICLTSRRSPAEESETPPSVVERCLCPQVDDSEPQLWPRAGLGSGLRALRMIHGRDQCTRQVSLENRYGGNRLSEGDDAGQARSGSPRAAHSRHYHQARGLKLVPFRDSTSGACARGDPELPTFSRSRGKVLPPREYSSRPAPRSRRGPFRHRMRVALLP
mgnify:CR=1 FL=1